MGPNDISNGVFKQGEQGVLPMRVGGWYPIWSPLKSASCIVKEWELEPTTPLTSNVAPSRVVNEWELEPTTPLTSNAAPSCIDALCSSTRAEAATWCTHTSGSSGHRSTYGWGQHGGSGQQGPRLHTAHDGSMHGCFCPMLGPSWCHHAAPCMLLSMLGPCAHATETDLVPRRTLPSGGSPPPLSHLGRAQKDDLVLRHGSGEAHRGRPPAKPRRGPARMRDNTRGGEIAQHEPHTVQLRPLWQFTRCQAPICTASYAVRSYSV